VAHIFKKAGIPLVAIDVPHPNATYFGVDNFESGYEAGVLLAQHALVKWKEQVDWVLGVGFAEAGSFVQSRISGAFDGIRERISYIPPARFVQIEGRGMREPSQLAMARFLANHRKGERILIATTTDSSALGILDAARHLDIESDIAIASQDCIPEVLEEMRSGNSAIIGSVSHDVESYGPRLIQLGISLMRGYTVPPYNYVRHRVVTPETLGVEKASSSAHRTGKAA
jgi:ribose transport system substrate-binding protein